MKHVNVSESPLTLQEFRRDILTGLSGRAKTVPCKYLYDATGARLFEAICDLEVYYPTRTELAILRRNINEIGSLLGPNCNLVELGSGSSAKTRLLLDHLDGPSSYVPVDVAGPQLFESCSRLAVEYPGLEVSPVCADYTNGFALPDFPCRSQRTVALFLGSTIGNFEPEEAEQFLRRMGRLGGPEGGLLIGVDLKKDPARLHRAYNDSQGVTAAFNLNVLTRANRELDANFDLSLFRHQAVYNERAGRIEMHLMSRRRQTVVIDNHEFCFEEGESIRTEHSYKYTLEDFRELAARAGLRVADWWMDERRWFSVHHLVPNQTRSNEESQIEAASQVEAA